MKLLRITLMLGWLAVAAMMRSLFQPRLVAVANDGEAQTAVANAEGEAVFQIREDGSFFIPFGEYPHKLGRQIFDASAANAIVAAHNSPLAKLKRWAGMPTYPVYIGHPDMPGSKDTDKRAYGWIESLAVENDGLRLTPKWSEPGQQLVANAHFKFYSPYWYTRKVGKGIQPVAMISMGLTNNPNIPVPALANDAADATDDFALQVAGVLGLDAAAASNEAIVSELERLSGLQAQLDAANESVTTLTTERDTARSELATANETIGTLTTERAGAESELAAANETATELRCLVVDGALDSAVANGRLMPGERTAKRDELLSCAANEFAGEIEALGKLPVKFKTKSTTGNLGGAKAALVKAANDPGTLAREERAMAVANEYELTNPAMPEHERKRIAWDRARAKNPELFDRKEKSPGAAA
jgi:phage I-like protein